MVEAIHTTSVDATQSALGCRSHCNTGFFFNSPSTTIKVSNHTDNCRCDGRRAVDPPAVDEKQQLHREWLKSELVLASNGHLSVPSSSCTSTFAATELLKSAQHGFQVSKGGFNFLTFLTECATT